VGTTLVLAMTTKLRSEEEDIILPVSALGSAVSPSVFLASYVLTYQQVPTFPQVRENPATLTPEQERHLLECGLEALDRIAGVRSVGHRSPAWNNSPASGENLLPELRYMREVPDDQGLLGVHGAGLIVARPR
jgi:hypothetical protein